MRRENSLPFPWIAFEYNEKKKKKSSCPLNTGMQGSKNTYIKLFREYMYKKTLRLSPMSSCIAIILNTFTVYIKMLHVFSNKLGDYISEWKMFFENETK